MKEQDTKKKKRISKKKQHALAVAILMAVCDALAIGLAYGAVLWARYDFVYSSIPETFLHAYLRFLPIYVPVCLLVFWLLHLYRSMWRYASFTELVRVLVASVITGVLKSLTCRSTSCQDALVL